MKTRFLGLCAAAIVASACAPVSTDIPTYGSAPSGSSPISTFTAENTQSRTESNTTFLDPDPETYVMVLPAVLKYFYYRKKAMISGAMDELWTQYPDLRSGIDSAKGINAEEFFVSNYRDLKLFDGNVFPEEYERLKVKRKNDEMEVLVHGMELYLFLDENEKFQESGSEFKIVLYLHMKDGHLDVFKTDEVMQSEWQKFSP